MTSWGNNKHINILIKGCPHLHCLLSLSFILLIRGTLFPNAISQNTVKLIWWNLNSKVSKKSKFNYKLINHNYISLMTMIYVLILYKCSYCFSSKYIYLLSCFTLFFYLLPHTQSCVLLALHSIVSVHNFEKKKTVSFTF